MKVLITGSSGQLASEFIAQYGARGIEVQAPSERDCDITDRAAVERTVDALRPSVIVNCAAYNLVDQAESDLTRAMLVNAEGPRVLAETAFRYGARMVHFGTDYVFDGEKADGPYDEGDAPHPLNAYGRSKLAGEQSVREVLADRALVLRLSWVYGPGQQNFIWKFLQRVREGKPLSVTCDEFSVPTWARLAAGVTITALDRGVSGLYHLTNSGYCSRYEWAKLLLRSVGADRFIRPVTRESLALPARRPMFSAMDNRSLAAALGIDIPAWDESVAAFVKERLPV